MNGNIEQQELRERLNLIESMIAEGRRKHESWGWTFLLWGVAYYVAIVWASWSHFAYAWPITMVAAAIVSIPVFIHRGKNIPNTTMGRAIGSIWTAMGISMFILFDALGFAGRLDTHTSVAAACALLGMTNADPVRLRSRLVDSLHRRQLRHRNSMRRRLPRRHLPLPDRLRNLHDGPRVPPTSPGRRPCLIFPNSILSSTENCASPSSPFS
jgi:hypothetical protein